MVAPRRGEIWWFDPDPVKGHEQGGARPGLVVSASTFNQGPQRLAMVLPITRRHRPWPFRLEIRPSESGLSAVSYIICDQLRTVTLERLLDTQPAGRVSERTLELVRDHLAAILQMGTLSRDL